MAVYRWIFSNLNLEGTRQDYRIQVLDEELRPYKDALWDLSCRMIAGEYRNRAFRQKSWFGGFLDSQKAVYLTALSGEQRQLLNLPLEGKSRGLFCTMAYGFTERDIGLYRRDEALFEPLKQILRIRNTGSDCPIPEDRGLSAHCAAYREKASGASGMPPRYNITRSSPETDTALWPLSLEKPVLTGGVCIEEAKRLLDRFPDALITVAEDAEIQYQGRRRSGVSASLQAVMDEDDRWREEEQRRQEAAEAERECRRQERAAQKQRLEREQKRMSKIKTAFWKILGGVAALGLIVFAIQKLI